jgi:signal transduction histidine kinase
VPSDDKRALAEGTYATRERIEQAAERLREFQAKVSRDALLRAMGITENLDENLFQRFQENVAAPPPSRSAPREYAALRADLVHADLGVRALPVAFSGALAVVGATDDAGESTPSRLGDVGQTIYNSQEFDARQRMNRQVTENTAGLWNVLPEEAPVPPMTSLQAVWIGDALILARTVSVNERQYIQGCWLDWPALETALLDEIRDLLPNASLVPGAFAEKPGRMLAALPVRIVPGGKSISTAALASPIRFSLVIAWTCIALGAVAVAALLIGALRLSERRGAFVSAVTHELRTPLTTFRIYTDLLAKATMQDETKRRHYVATLGAEADRLSHLVENVLAYSRLTGRLGFRLAEPVPVQHLLRRVTDRLGDRAARAGMELVVEPDENVRGARIAADESLVEQILLNLVDNACKYAASARADGTPADRRIHLEVAADDRAVVLRVRDHGPGVPRDLQRRIFRAFAKSAHEAAHSAAGIGLGLALSRRLARDMGGDLRLDQAATEGACFVLALPNA